MVDITIYEERLLKRKKELDKRLHQIEHDLDEPVSQDTEDRATEREDDEVMEAIGNSGLDELVAIEAALMRIKNQTFGQCVDCGNDISTERLDVIPTAVKCKNCM